MTILKEREDTPKVKPSHPPPPGIPGEGFWVATLLVPGKPARIVVVEIQSA